MVVEKGLTQKARFVEHREGQLSEFAYEEFVDLLRELDSKGNTEFLPGALRWSGCMQGPSATWKEERPRPSSVRRLRRLALS
jgi:hypothetical protein